MGKRLGGQSRSGRLSSGVYLLVVTLIGLAGIGGGIGLYQAMAGKNRLWGTGDEAYHLAWQATQETLINPSTATVKSRSVQARQDRMWDVTMILESENILGERGCNEVKVRIAYRPENGYRVVAGPWISQISGPPAD